MSYSPKNNPSDMTRRNTSVIVSDQYDFGIYKQPFKFTQLKVIGCSQHAATFEQNLQPGVPIDKTPVSCSPTKILMIDSKN